MNIEIETPIGYVNQIHTDVPIPRVGEWVTVHKVGGGDTTLRVQSVGYDYINGSVAVVVE